ncbi:hypothetical protein A1A1_11992 [Planococcus antarcticus DSM 14505]|uniref:DUF4181 domain-containing protein n=1 Tax=Planococcus antarcticus DSM 14505 TaxID=1185653 RepID=A0A1C7DE31_9BACL|nr:hypothetical protein [Planococcus antarcticus]ANU09503.1 hypothetical protein BBH88_03870 [Planococcus antarcticus DSM 14505]EIM06283.1 hypothetical protein A1A1_11992 [Planococcus antarcticus DSM 14505]
MSTISTKKTNLNNSGVLGTMSNGFYAAIIYGMLFVSLMLATGKEITVDGLAIPALLIYLVVKVTEYFTTKNKKTATSQWVVVGSFILSVATAIVMTVILN